jgi:hypothetical protein
VARAICQINSPGHLAGAFGRGIWPASQQPDPWLGRIKPVFRPIG